MAALAKSVSPPAWPPAGDDDDDAAAAGKEDCWVHHLPPLDNDMPLGAAEACCWEAPCAAAQPQEDNTFLRWIIGGDDGSSAVMDHIPASSAHQPLPSLPPLDTPPPPNFALKPNAEAEAEAANDGTTAALAVEQLAEAATLAEAGDVLGARETLLAMAPDIGAPGTPLLRSALYLKDALRVALSGSSSSSNPNSVVLIKKLGAYKAFSEISPVLQFAHFTCVQAVLDHLAAAACIHVLDLDIGVGDQWASLMHKLARRRPGAALKVTALVSGTASLELQLVHDNLSSFAAETRVQFRFAAFNLDAVNPAELLAIAAGEGEAIAVHLPAGSVRGPVLELVRRLGAKLVVSVDRGCDRGELPFAAHLLQAFQWCASMLESMDAVVGAGSDVIERLVIQPRVESCVLRRYRAAANGEKTPPWRAMLASAGFVPVPASSFAEAQADSLVKKVPVRGFRVQKRGAGELVLHWQRGELLSVSAWRLTSSS